MPAAPDTHPEETLDHPLLPSSVSASGSPRVSASPSISAVPDGVYFDAGASLDAPADPARASAELDLPAPSMTGAHARSSLRTRLGAVRIALGRFGRLVGMRMPGALYTAVAQDDAAPPARRVVGSGLGQDGVFSNMNAKPERRRRMHNAGIEGDRGQDDDLADDDEIPPSYAAAAADAVPPYWESTIANVFPHPLAPGGSGWTPDSASGAVGAIEDLIIDGMPVGNHFGLLWNLLVSVAFQYVGFILTFLLHTTHAAKAGSRAGLGFTLVQYGASLHSSANTLRTGSGSDAGADSGSASGSRAASGTAQRPQPSVDRGRGDAPDSSTTDWVAWILIGLGSVIFLGSMVSYARLCRMGATLVLAARRQEADLEAAAVSTAAAPAAFTVGPATGDGDGGGDGDDGAAGPSAGAGAGAGASRSEPRTVMEVFRTVMRHNRQRAAAREDATGERWAVPAPVFQLDDLEERSGSCRDP